MNAHPQPDANAVDFSTTHWSVIATAVGADSGLARAALERLCARYWWPVFAFLYRRQHDRQEAEDLTQGFFQFLLTHETLRQAQPERGRFRSFLLAALTNFVRNEQDKQRTWKRGGRLQFVSLGAVAALPYPTARPPEQEFERDWAITLVQRVLTSLRAEFQARGKATLFAGLQVFLTNEPQTGDYDRLSEQSGLSPAALKVALHRLRRRFGELLRREVAHTVRGPEEIEGEIRHLLAMLG